MIDEARLKKELDAEQCRAALRIHGPMLILAGAGSGKTRAITFKIAHLISVQKVDPRRILAVTFTNKAAKEMRERITHILGGSVSLDWMGTFHSVCMRILRLCLGQPAISQHLGWSYSRNFSIYDDDDQRRLLKEVVLPQLGEVEVSELRKISGRISKTKNTLIAVTDAGGTRQLVQTPERFREKAEWRDDEHFAAIYAEYQNRLMAADAMDFDDLLFKTVELFQKLPNVAAQFANRFQYVFVDEYQDTNDVQYALLRFLVAPQGNITVVGDDDQSIYGWRGANIGIIRNFHQDFAPVEIVKLERNYRSTGLIVRGAGSVIARNDRPKEMCKNVYSQLEDGEPIHILHLPDDRSEAERVADNIFRLGPDSYGNTAVFYRTNAQSRSLEKALSDKRIPCRLFGGTRFWDRKEVRDILAYLRLLVNGRDDAALLRILNVPPRGIGKTTIEDLTRQMGERDLWETLAFVVESANTKIAAKLKGFYEMMVTLQGLKSELPMPLLAEKVLELTRYAEFLKVEDAASAEEREANLLELVNALREYEEDHPESGLDEFLQEIALLTDADKSEESGGRVTLMTIHMAKGLEFELVHIAGCDDGIFPLVRKNSMASASEEKSQMEEERRLFYVGATRAKRNLYLYSTEQRFWQGRIEPMRPSRFLEELDESTVVRDDETRSDPKSTGFHGFSRKESTFNPSKYSSGYSSTQRSTTIRRVFHDKPIVQENTRKTNIIPFPDRQVVADEYSQENLYFRPGVKVHHSRFGQGIVRSVAGSGDDARVEVQFRDGVVRKLVLKYANLTLVSG